MLNMGEESYNQIITDIIPLITKHHMNHAPSAGRALAPSFDTYRNMNTAGSLKIISLRDDSKLVGYSTWVIQPELHNVKATRMILDLLYLEENYRRGWTGYKVVRDMIRYVSRYPVQYLQVGDGGNLALRAILKRLGFIPREIKHELEIKNG